MSIRDSIQTGVRTILGSSVLGQSLEYSQRSNAPAGKAAIYGDWTAITGLLEEQEGVFQSGELGEIIRSTATCEIDDSAQELDVYDRIRESGASRIWGIIGKRHVVGKYVYALQEVETKASGPARRSL